MNIGQDKTEGSYRISESFSGSPLVRVSSAIYTASTVSTLRPLGSHYPQSPPGVLLGLGTMVFMKETCGLGRVSLAPLPGGFTVCISCLMKGFLLGHVLCCVPVSPVAVGGSTGDSSLHSLAMLFLQ